MKKASTKSTTRSTTKKTTPKKVEKSTVARQGLGTTIDLFAAVLIVSLLLNLFTVCIWVTLSVTTQYDVALAQFLLGR